MQIIEEALKSATSRELIEAPVDAMKVRRETTARAGKGITEGNDRTWRDPANYCHSR